jgi:outer membrane phospholipase A
MHYNTQSIVEKENTATVAHSLTDKHTCIFHLPAETSQAPSSQNSYLKKKSICLWQNQIHIVNDLKILVAQNRNAVLQNVKRCTL